MSSRATRDRVHYEFHTIIREHPLTQEELDDLASLGWVAYATGEPTEHSYQFSYQFRRSIVPSPRVEALASVGN
jgi:hypothetical protein